MLSAFYGLFIPFLGTTLGSCGVFFQRKNMSESLHLGMQGFAAGVMTAASVWSLLIPAMEQSEHLGKWSFIPAASGFWAGILFILLLDRIILYVSRVKWGRIGQKTIPPQTAMLVLTVTLHNIPEGIAVGVVYAGLLSGEGVITKTAAFALSLGIAIQNIPEGAIISMPLHNEGTGKVKSFFWGVFSGAVEPAGALAAIWLGSLAVLALPYFLSFAAGAMIYVVVEELIPQMSRGMEGKVGTLCYAAGFTLMMALDVC